MKKHEIFARNLETIRKINGQSLAEFAQEIGVPKSTLQSIRLSGHTTLDTATRIADGLNLPLDSLVGDVQLSEKLDIAEYLLRTVDWFRTLSSSEQEETILHFRNILEVASR